MIDEGTTPGTIEESVELFASAAQGSLHAMTSLAVMYASGRGVPQDFGQAHTYYEMAARKGNPHGMQGLGVLYFNGEGVTTDRIEAMAFWLVALTAGNETASGYYQQTSHTYDDAEMHAVIERANELAEEFGYPGGFTPWNVSDED
ncbi:MAG: tetratricopeptide repeat protein [Altererythrobacter sp.]